jgi:hypothetical protein
MKTRDNTKGEKIIKIVYESHPKGVRFRELSRRSGISRGGLEWWLNYLGSLEIIPKPLSLPINLTPLAFQKLESGKLLPLPKDQMDKKLRLSTSKENKKKKKSKLKHEYINRKQKIIFLILSKAVFGSSKFFRTNTPMAGNVGVFDPIERKTPITYDDIHINGVGIDDIKPRLPKLDSDIPNKEAFMPENRFNIDNNDLFGYLRISNEEAEKHIRFLLNHSPPILKSIEKRDNIVVDPKLKLNNIKEHHEKELESNFIQSIKLRYLHEQRYEIADKLLKEFILKFILFFNAEIEFILECEYVTGHITDSMADNKNKIIDGITIYRNWLKDLFGTGNKLHEIFQSQLRKKKNLKDYNERKGYQTRIDHHYKVICSSNSIFDKDLNIQSQYNTLEKIYPDVWKALHLLLPDDIKKVINYLYEDHKPK